MIKSYSLAEDDVDYLLRLPEVIRAKEKIDLLSNNGQINFYINIPISLKKQIGNKMGINLAKMETIPMRWIKGDTPPHSDCIKDFAKDVAKDFANTYLAYLTNSKGHFIVDGNVYAISKGDAYIFSEGLRHETIGTGLEPRLLLGPMSENGKSLWMNAITPPPGVTPPPVREYDQILSGDVKIEKVCSNNGEYTHKITFSKKDISKVLEYQIWSASSTKLNNDRIVKEVKATTWVKRVFRKVEDGSLDNLSPACDVVKLAYDPVICPNGKKYPNSTTAGCAGQINCKPFSDVPYTPTAVMELDDGECPYHHKANKHAECIHVFVIKRAKVNKCGQVVFYVSSKDIILPSDPDKELKLLKKIPTGSFCKARFDIDGAPNYFQMLRQKYSIVITATEGGTLSNKGGSFTEGDIVTVKATPDEGYLFDHWEGINSSNSMIKFQATGSFFLKAIFKLTPRVETIEKALIDDTGYILLIENGGKTCYLINHKGQRVLQWNFDLSLGQDAELASDGSLYGLFKAPDYSKDMDFGGRGGIMRKINTQNKILWEFKISNNNEIAHHDIQLLPSGNILTLVWNRVTKEEAAKLGYIADHDIFVEKLIEINPNSNEIVWSWNSWDHVIQNKIPAHSTFGQPIQNRNKIDIMYNYQSDYHPFIKSGDIMHANGIDYLPELDIIAISVNFYNEVWFVDHSTSTEEAKGSTGGRFNVGGDLIYRFGNPATYGYSALKILDINHHPSFVRYDNGYGLLIFNNNRSERRSKVMEFNLPFTLTDTDPLEIGANPQIVFEYSNDEMFFDIAGGAVRLSNGNTLICEGDLGLWEVSPLGQLVWKYDGRGTRFWRGLFYSKESSAIKRLLSQ